MNAVHRAADDGHDDVSIVDDEYDEDDEDETMTTTMADANDATVPISSLRTLPNRRYHLTRRGRILQMTTERYLRDDLGYGTMLVPSSSSSKKNNVTIAGKIVQLVPWTIEDANTLWGVLGGGDDACDDDDDDDVGGGGNIPLRLAVVDTNVLLHPMDVLEYLRDDDYEGGVLDPPDADVGGRSRARTRHRAIANAIVIPQTALEECRHRSLVMYRRATDLVRSGGGSGRRRNGRPVIVFADAHHVNTQIRPTPPSSAAVDDDDDRHDEDGTTINDVNDARLRGVALFYGRSLMRDDSSSRRKRIEVVFLSDDAASRKLAHLEGRGGMRNYYEARSVRDHVALLQKEDPTLNMLDMVAHFGGGSYPAPPGFDEADMTPTTTAIAPYEPHVSSSDLSRGLRANRYHQGVYRSDRDTHTGGYVTLRRGEERVAVVVRGRADVNRAVDGDIVAVELFAIERWLSVAVDDDDADDDGGGHGRDKATKSGGEEGRVEDAVVGGGRTGIAADTAEPTVRDIDNIAEEVPVDDEGRTLRRPAGRVVGIIRRNFHNRNFCGSICTVDDAVAARRREKGAGGGNDGYDRDEYDNDEGTERLVHPHDAIAARHEREHPDGITSTVVFFSIDQRVPPILLRTTQRERLVGMRILVSMDSWPADSEYPLGHYVQTLGVAGTKDTETQVLLQEFRIPCEPFPAKVCFCVCGALEREKFIPVFTVSRLLIAIFETNFFLSFVRG
jgi:exosome complex exonuclease DIS3/RRP44